MFQAVITRAQDAVGDVVAHAATRALMAVPFVIAGGFGIAGLYLRLAREYGTETASLLMASLFFVIGLLTFTILSLRKHDSSETTASEADTEADSASTASSAPSFSSAEKDLLLAGLTTAAPIALPQLLRMMLRNLPLIAVVAAALFVLTRDSSSDEDAGAGAEPMAAPAE